MKQTLRVIGTALILIAAAGEVYLIGSFIAASFDIAKWGLMLRGFAALFYILGSIAVIVERQEIKT